MKKVFFILTMAVLSVPVVAQVQKGLDTIYGRQPEYYYTYWYDTSEWYNHPDSASARVYSSRSIKFMNTAAWLDNSILTAQMHTAQPLKVKGVAIMVSHCAVHPDLLFTPQSRMHRVVDSAKMPEYVYLLRDGVVDNDSGNCTMQAIIDSARWDTLQPKVYCLPATADGRYEPHYCYIYEVMFNTEHTVEGCFSITGTKNSNAYDERLGWLHYPTTYLTFGNMNEDYGLRTYSHYCSQRNTDSIWWQWKCGTDYHEGLSEYFRGYGPFAVITDPVHVDLASTCTTCGSVDGMGVYPTGSQQTIRAIPNADYHFSHWSDGDDSNPRTIEIWEDVSLSAYFDKDAVDIDPVEADGLFTLTPNPTTGKVTVRIENSALEIENSEISVRDAAGHEVLRQAVAAGETGVVLNLSGMAAGTYFVTLTAGDRSATRKLVLK